MAVMEEEEEEEETLEAGGAMLEELPLNPAPSVEFVNVNVNVDPVEDLLLLGRFLGTKVQRHNGQLRSELFPQE